MKSAPVYNPKHKSLVERFEELSVQEQERELAKVLVTHTKNMRDNLLPFFAQREDPREGPDDATQAVMWIEESSWSSEANNLANFCFELDFVFRLLRYVVKENPFLVENATKLTAVFCKSCIARSIPEAHRSLNDVISYFRQEGIGGKLQVFSRLCFHIFFVISFFSHSHRCFTSLSHFYFIFLFFTFLPSFLVVF
jgi:hypothetical protein